MLKINKDGLSMANRAMNHFQGIYRNLDPQEISSRCNLDFNGEAFSLRLMGKSCQVLFPDFKLLALDPRNSQATEITNSNDKILIMRYLCEGRYAESMGKQLSYREVPWGELYYPNFEGRCIKRLAYSFGKNLDVFIKIMETTEGLNAQKLNKGDAGYKFDFLNGLSMSFFIWAADDEFPPSAQILFDDNFPLAFTAEDMSVVGDVAISHLKSFI